jgi:hypothetical protein
VGRLRSNPGGNGGEYKLTHRRLLLLKIELLGPLGYATCPVELGAGPRGDARARAKSSVAPRTKAQLADGVGHSSFSTAASKIKHLKTLLHADVVPLCSVAKGYAERMSAIFRASHSVVAEAKPKAIAHASRTGQSSAKN